MPRRCTHPVLAAVLATLFVLSGAQAQEYPESFDEPMPLFEKGLGSFTREITTGSPEAQAYFNQGIQFMYAFTPMDAARSFVEAHRADPDCAFCFWAEAWSWGAYLNGPLTVENSPRAHRAAERALALRDENTSPVEDALIDAMAIRYGDKLNPDTRAAMDTAYAMALAEVWERFPDDLDVGTLFGESLMLLEPRRGNWDIERAPVRKIHRTLEEVLVQDIRHPGACHLYIHATESTVRPGKAEGCADFLGNSIPGASHINHMPSHTYNRIGRWGSAVRANIDASHSDMKAAVGEGFAIYPSHNLHMLLYAASNDGQGAVAIQAGKDYGKMVPGGVFYEVLTMVRFGRFDEILELPESKRPQEAIPRGLWDFGRGYAHLRMDHRGPARADLERVQRARRETPPDVNFRGHPAESLLGVVVAILEGEIQRADGDLTGAIATFERGVEIYDKLRYDEPEPLPFAAQHWLGHALLEAGLWAEAEEVYKAELAAHPHNGWSLYGLGAALRAQGKAAEADRVNDALRASWARSDTWIRGSRF